MKKNDRTEEEYKIAAKKSFSIAGMCRELGLGTFGANYRRIHRAIKKYNIDTSHFTGKGWNVGGLFKPNKKIIKSLAEILVENSTYDNSNFLRQRLINEGVKKNICENCGLSIWQGSPIPLQLHHINGNRVDNRIENLQVLCPNCHALTDNYCGKNSKTKSTIKKINIKEIYGDNKIENIFGKKIGETIKKNQVFCQYCGKEILSKKNKKYCSTLCAHNAQIKMPSQEIISQYISEGKSNAEIAKLCNVTETSVRNWKKNIGSN